ncbi:hypothetical protein ABZ772_24860 [Streptomyces griseoincarnatus]
MSKQPTPEDLEAAAAEDVRRADQTLAALEQRVLDDDPDVTPQEIETARSARHFAGLREQAAKKKAAALRDQLLADARKQAFAEARAILAEHTDDDVAAAEAAAGEAMMRLREAVRARNDARDRARRVLEACPAVQPHNPVHGQRTLYPQFGYGQYMGDPILWLDGESFPVVNEDVVMDRARKHPAQVDHDQAGREQEQARARLIARDAALHGEDRAAFHQLPATRRKAALDRLGIDWNSHMREREKTHDLEPIQQIRGTQPWH